MIKRLLLLCLFSSACGASFGQELNYVIKNNDWDPDSLGTHRVVLTVADPAQKVAKALITWRRNDLHPEQKGVIVIDSATNERITNVGFGTINREACILYFEPKPQDTKYFVYYLPYKIDRKSNYPNAKYLSPVGTASVDWLRLTGDAANITKADVDCIEEVNAMNSFYPMEVIATAAEVTDLVHRNPGRSYLVFPEDRLHSIRMKYDLPQRWIISDASSVFNGEAKKGENYAYQLGIYPVTKNLNDVKITFSDLKTETGQVIPVKAMSCLNTGGTDYRGDKLSKIVTVTKGDVQAMWCLVNIPSTAAAGVYEGSVTVSVKNAENTVIGIAIKVDNETALKGGVNEPWKQTRLTWLNSTLGQNNTVIKPYTPLVVKGNSISLLGRKLVLGKNGLPQKIETYFTPEMTSVSLKPKEVIARPVSFVAEDSEGAEPWTALGMRFTQKQPGTVQWEAVDTSDYLRMDVKGSIEFDGFVSYTVKITALDSISLSDIRMELPLNKASAKYIIGLNLKGEERPQSYKWKWDVAHKNQDGAWLGDVNAGLQFSLRDENYVRPLNTNFYLQKPLLLPSSWGNENKGALILPNKETL